MKTLLALIVGLVVGMLLMALLGWSSMPGMMLRETPSPYGLDETVERIQANAEASGWVVAGVKQLHKSIEKHGGHTLEPVVLVELCQADHAYGILETDRNKVVSVMMPCTIAVYEKSDGSTWIATMNAGLLGKMFGGDVKRIMGGEVARQQREFIAFVD